MGAVMAQTTAQISTPARASHMLRLFGESSAEWGVFARSLRPVLEEMVRDEWGRIAGGRGPSDQARTIRFAVRYKF